MKRFYIVLIVLIFVAGACFAGAEKDYNQYLINSLNDDNIGIRYSAAQLLGERKVEAAVDPLIARLRFEKDSRVKVVVAMALFSIGDPKAIPALKQFAKKEKVKEFAHIAKAIVAEMESPQYAAK